jgi:hypothetical protein
MGIKKMISRSIVWFLLPVFCLTADEGGIRAKMERKPNLFAFLDRKVGTPYAGGLSVNAAAMEKQILDQPNPEEDLTVLHLLQKMLDNRALFEISVVLAGSGFGNSWDHYIFLEKLQKEIKELSKNGKKITREQKARLLAEIILRDDYSATVSADRDARIAAARAMSQAADKFRELASPDSKLWGGVKKTAVLAVATSSCLFTILIYSQYADDFWNDRPTQATEIHTILETDKKIWENTKNGIVNTPEKVAPPPSEAIVDSIRAKFDKRFGNDLKDRKSDIED